MGEVLETFEAARRNRKKAKEFRRLIERLDRRATIIGVGRDAFPIVHALRALGFDAYTVLPISRQHPLTRPVDRESPWAAREKLKKLIEEKGWIREQVRKLVRMIEEAAHSDTVILVDTGTAGTHPATVKMIYEIMREMGETRKNLKIITAVLAAQPIYAKNVDIVANVVEGDETDKFYQRWESLPKFTEPAGESRHRAPGMEQAFPFERFLLPFAKHVAHVAGLVARIDPEAALKWVKLYETYYQRLSMHPHYGIRILKNDEVERLRQEILRDLREIRKALEEEVRKRERGKRRKG